MTQGGHDRRRAGEGRHRISIGVTVVDLPRAALASRGEIEDLSLAGARLRLADGAGIQGRVAVTLHFQSQPPLVTAATVRWTAARPNVGDWQVGIEFGERLPSGLVAELAAAELWVRQLNTQAG